MIERIAGSVDVGLTKAGEHEARDVGTALAMRGGLDEIVSSPRKRAQQMAQIIAILNGKLPVKLDAGLNPWFVGFIEGQDEHAPLIKKAVKAMLRNPAIVPPGRHPDSTEPGESFETYAARLAACMMKICQEWQRNPRKLGLVTHSRTVRLIMAWVKTGLDKPSIAPEVMQEGSGTELPPVMRLTIDAPKLGHVRRESLFGGPDLPKAIYLIRHAPTPWDDDKQVSEHAAYPHANKKLLAGLIGRAA